MGVDYFLIFIVLLLGFYMSWNIGANDVSNAMGTSVGSGALTLKRAVIVAAVLEFSGAFTLGSNVSETLQKGLVNPEYFFHDPTILVMGMMSALLATSIWLQVASYFGWPVSTTHAIVGAIIGFGLIIGGTQAIHWKEVGSVAASWVISPGLSGLIAFLIFSFLQKKILYALNPIHATKTMAPYLVFLLLATFCLGTGSDGIKHLHMHLPLPYIAIISLVIGTLGALLFHLFLSKARFSSAVPSSGSIRGAGQILSLTKALKHLQRVRLTASGNLRNELTLTIDQVKELKDSIRKKIEAKPTTTSDYKVVEKIFSYLQIMSACFVAFAHGANDVANAIGPVAMVVQTLRDPAHLQSVAPIPLWLLALGGLGIVIGLSTWGWRVIETIGRKITELTPSRGFCAEFSAATTILIASKLGLPISTTHCIVGSVLGIGIARGISALNLKMIRDIVLSWIITIPSSAIACVLIFYIIKIILLSFSVVI